MPIQRDTYWIRSSGRTKGDWVRVVNPLSKRGYVIYVTLKTAKRGHYEPATFLRLFDACNLGPGQ